MAETPKELPLVFTAGPKYVLAPDHKYVYVNAARMGVSAWDFRIVCSVAKDLGDGLHEDQVTLIMSPQHAKVMLSNWINTINVYEGMFGPIPDLGPILAAAKQKTKDDQIGKAKPKKTAPTRKKRTRLSVP